jgi:hypothetical protein
VEHLRVKYNKLHWLRYIRGHQPPGPIEKKKKNHPTQHKFAAVGFLYNRLNTYDLPTEEYKREEQIIHSILENNSFPTQQQKTLTQRLRKQTEPNSKEKKKWATFAYIGRDDIYHKHL